MPIETLEKKGDAPVKAFRLVAAHTPELRDVPEPQAGPARCS